MGMQAVGATRYPRPAAIYQPTKRLQTETEGSKLHTKIKTKQQINTKKKKHKNTHTNDEINKRPEKIAGSQINENWAEMDLCKY